MHFIDRWLLNTGEKVTEYKGPDVSAQTGTKKKLLRREEFSSFPAGCVQKHGIEKWIHNEKCPTITGEG